MDLVDICEGVIVFRLFQRVGQRRRVVRRVRTRDVQVREVGLEEVQPVQCAGRLAPSAGFDEDQAHERRDSQRHGCEDARDTPAFAHGGVFFSGRLILWLRGSSGNPVVRIREEND